MDERGWLCFHIENALVWESLIVCWFDVSMLNSVTCVHMFWVGQNFTNFQILLLFVMSLAIYLSSANSKLNNWNEGWISFYYSWHKRSRSTISISQSTIWYKIVANLLDFLMTLNSIFWVVNWCYCKIEKAAVL